MTRREPWFAPPGSAAARDAGCLCPVIDNGHGHGYMGGMKDEATGETLFAITVGCPVHPPRETANSHPRAE